jgi:hypothetical protein
VIVLIDVVAKHRVIFSIRFRTQGDKGVSLTAQWFNVLTSFSPIANSAYHGDSLDLDVLAPVFSKMGPYGTPNHKQKMGASLNEGIMTIFKRCK